MMNRRGFVLGLTTSLVALVFVVGSVLADELMGTIIKVDTDAKQLTVVQKGTDKEIKVKVTDDTEQVTKKGSRKVDLEKLEKFLEKVQDKGAKGIQVKITHEKGVASKIEFQRKRKTAQ
jgi:catalase